MRLAGRTALITGAGGPMGRAIATRFAREGAGLLLTDISGNRLAEAVAEAEPLLQAGARVAQHRADVTEAAEVDALLGAGAGLGPVDVLINVVGGIRGGALFEPMTGLAEHHWDDTFQLNLKGGFHLVQRLAPGMVERGYGRIVNFASIALAGEAGQTHYGAAKAAVASMTRSLAMELAPAVNVNCVAPGLINTSVVPRLPPEMVARYRDGSMLKRLGEPDEIASAVLFLGSEEASYITGETLAVSGGIPAAL